MKRIILVAAVALTLAATSIPTISHAAAHDYIIAGMVVLTVTMGPLTLRPAMPPRTYVSE